MIALSTIFLIAALGFSSWLLIIIALAIWNLRKLARETTPETQDDFQISAARWAHLPERDQGE